MRVSQSSGLTRWGVGFGLLLVCVSGCAAGTGDEAGYTQVSDADSGSGATGGGGGEAGSGGSGGDSGSGGSSGSGGTGGSSGSGGTGGSSGSGGTGGASGTGGTGGSSGTGGDAGTGGSSGSSGSGGTAGSGGTSGSGGSGGTGGPCVHKDQEPNDTEAVAESFAEISDCDGAGDYYYGTLEGSTDKDWFTFHAHDQAGCSVNPTFLIQSSTTFLLCAYFTCDTGGDSINCSSGSSVDTSPDGLSGCCTTNGTLEPSVNCSGFDDSSQVYVLVSSPSNQACQDYTVDYHY